MNYGRYHTRTQKPQLAPAAAKWDVDGAPAHTAPSKQGLDMGDEGMVGHHQADAIMIMNAHPHQAHSVGYDDASAGTQYQNHGFDAVHIKHGRRDKGPEHHPPQGLWEPDAIDHSKK
jgi:hypothetical protein